MPAAAIVALGVVGSIGNLVNSAFVAISRAKTLAAFIKASVRTSLQGFLALLRAIESTYKKTLTNLRSVAEGHRQESLDLARTLAECLRVCRFHSDEIDDQFVSILQSRCRAWTAMWAESHLERHRIALEAAKMNLSLCMSTISQSHANLSTPQTNSLSRGSPRNSETRYLYKETELNRSVADRLSGFVDR
ncbi:hypothetical protein GJ744_009777 [Endocarpon pusillum]|uniref:Fungal N-terminal domain-containing protein n=1 Tax=Endocarpon pusillum TaxID=364733 RepID=A0A8H7EB24_9EURO|nr:hypothetical protein GJ744_009777 [Endocarpon pusillum]